jgi:hypothetical protein
MPDLIVRSDNRRFVEAAVQHGLDFIVIGGAAVSFHGCREPADVGDLDILIAPDPENADRLISILREMNITVGWSARDVARTGVHLPIKCIHCTVDVLTPKADEDYERFRGSSIESMVGFNPVRVIDRENLIAMKSRTVAEMSEDLAKHERDLSCLRAV